MLKISTQEINFYYACYDMMQNEMQYSFLNRHILH